MDDDDPEAAEVAGGEIKDLLLLLDGAVMPRARRVSPGGGASRPLPPLPPVPPLRAVSPGGGARVRPPPLPLPVPNLLGREDDCRMEATGMRGGVRTSRMVDAEIILSGHHSGESCSQTY